MTLNADEARLRRRRVAVCSLVLGLAACGESEIGRDSASASAGLMTAGASGGSTGAAGAEGTSGDEGTDGGAPLDTTDAGGETPYFDVGNAGEGSGGEPEMGCQAVDFLFVIDNSVSMQNEQEALIGAFPGFMAAIESALAVGSDYHVLVTDTDAWGRCDTANPWEGARPNHSTCNDYIEQTVFDECDRTLGAGVVHPAGEAATNALCQPQGGNRYIVAGEPNLADTFACMATVGLAGHPSERPMDAMEAALEPGINQADGCNAGFLRDDALLVVTFVSDDPNYEDAGEPQDWYDAVVAAKNGDPGGVVVLGLTPDWAGCQSGSPKGSHWSEFVSMWNDNGLHGNVCSSAEDYVVFFEAAVSTIAQACDVFEPPG